MLVFRGLLCVKEGQTFSFRVCKYLAFTWLRRNCFHTSTGSNALNFSFSNASRQGMKEIKEGACFSRGYGMGAEREPRPPYLFRDHCKRCCPLLNGSRYRPDQCIICPSNGLINVLSLGEDKSSDLEMYFQTVQSIESCSFS